MGMTSVWAGTSRSGRYPALEGETTADVAVVGGGITGLTAALRLADEGKDVVVLEARSVGSGSTGNSTGNLYETVSGGLADVIEKWGSEVARDVAASRREAVAFVESTVSRLAIDCAFQRCALHLYPTSEGGEEHVGRERKAAEQAGIISAHIAPAAHSPLAHGNMLVIESQAQFHPLAYVQGLAWHVAAKGVRVHEDSPVVSIDEDRRTVHTSRGTVVAGEIVLATHTPKGLFGVHAEMKINREYGLAARLATGEPPHGIFWGLGTFPHSIRSLSTPDGVYLVVVADERPTGGHDAAEAVAALEQFVRAHFDVATIDFRWSAQNYRSPDRLPYIGRTLASQSHIATGFAADGLTFGTLAGNIVADAILGVRNRWSELYRASRVAPIKSAKGILDENVAVAKAFIRDRITPPGPDPLSLLAPDSGSVVEVDGERLAVYRDAHGELTALSPVCTHLKCIVHWNAAEKSWDCPCHGSRFDLDGSVIEGPAVSPLARAAIPAYVAPDTDRSSGIGEVPTPPMV